MPKSPRRFPLKANVCMPHTGCSTMQSPLAPFPAAPSAYWPRREVLQSMRIGALGNFTYRSGLARRHSRDRLRPGKRNKSSRDHRRCDAALPARPAQSGSPPGRPAARVRFRRSPADNARHVRLRHLLAHNSGFPGMSSSSAPPPIRPNYCAPACTFPRSRTWHPRRILRPRLHSPRQGLEAHSR